MTTIQPNDLVRIRPTNGNQNYTGALVKEVCGKTAWVVPFGHKVPIPMPLNRLKRWAAANRDAEQMRRRRNAQPRSGKRGE
jgi:hypothetical protein